jgi:hypothetical protein
MIKKLLSICAIAILLCFVGCSGSSIVNENNDTFSNAVKAITSDEVVLSDLATFEWDTMYNFVHFTPKKDIEKVIGFSSKDIKETYNEGHTQLIFVKDNKVVCSIWGYSNNLGYFVSFRRYDGEYLAIQNDEIALFTVDYSGEELLLTYVSEWSE